MSSKKKLQPVAHGAAGPSSASATAEGKKKKDTTIVLPNFSEEHCREVEARYGMAPEVPQIRIAPQPTHKTTKISDVFTGGVDLAHPFLDEAKKEKRVVPTMIQRLSAQGQLPIETTISCYWCRHAFETQPIGCPVRFVSSQLCKCYISEITKDPYLIKENIVSGKKARMVECEKPEGINLSIVEKDYYETDGIFCSFNCCLAWIDENKNNPMYAQSKELLFRLYTDTYGKFPTSDTISKAPHWRLLRDYGGHLSIDDFRASFNTVIYTAYNKVASRPKMHTIGFLFEEKHRF